MSIRYNNQVIAGIPDKSNLANIDLSNLSEAGENHIKEVSQVDTKVSKAGDTMTGPLKIDTSIMSGLEFQTGNFQMNDRYLQDITFYGGIDGNRTANIRVTKFTNNTKNSLEFNLSQAGTNTNRTAISLSMDKNGVASISANAGVKSGITTWAFPSNKYTDLTLGANGSTYTAPANGWVVLRKTANAVGQAVQLTNQSNGLITVSIAVGSTNGLAVYMPVAKGQNVLITYSAGGATNTFRFVYAVGDQ